MDSHGGDARLYTAARSVAASLAGRAYKTGIAAISNCVARIEAKHAGGREI